MNKIRNIEMAHFDSTTRTKTVRYHISLALIYKILAMGIGYLLVPLTINYLNVEGYGIWMTLLSVLVVLMGIYILVLTWNRIYSYFLNGIGKIKLQIYSAIIAGSINIPLSIYFAKYLSMGISGVVLGTIISLSFFAIIGSMQTYFILKTDKTQKEVR